jgi:hypothetical protein
VLCIAVIGLITAIIKSDDIMRWFASKRPQAVATRVPSPTASAVLVTASPAAEQSSTPSVRTEVPSSPTPGNGYSPSSVHSDSDQFPDCAHTSTEGQAECQPTAQAVYVVNDRSDGQVEVTIRAAMILASLPGTTTSMDQVLTLAAGERRELGCLIYPPQTRTTWDLVNCRPL